MSDSITPAAPVASFMQVVAAVLPGASSAHVSVSLDGGTPIIRKVTAQQSAGQAQALGVGHQWDHGPHNLTLTCVDYPVQIMGLSWNDVWYPLTATLTTKGQGVSQSIAPTQPATAPVSYAPSYATLLNSFVLVQDYRFGNARADATIKCKSDLDLCFSPRYIYGGYGETLNAEGNGCDGLYGNYWARHVDTPEGATDFVTQYGPASSVHVFQSDHLVLKAYANPTPPAGAVTGGPNGGILSAMLRAWATLVPNRTFFRARVYMPPGKWSWPALWLNPGQEDYAPLNGPRGNVLQPLGWPPEIDGHDGFGYDNVLPGTYFRPGEPTSNNDAAWGRKFLWEDATWASNPTWDYRKPGAADGWLAGGWHEIAVLWLDGVLTYYVDGAPVTQRQLDWDNSPAAATAHLLITNQVVATFNPNPGAAAGVPDQGGYGAGGWDYAISDLQVYQVAEGATPAVPNPGNLSPAPGVPSSQIWAALPKLAEPLPPSIKTFGLFPPPHMKTGMVNPSTYSAAFS